MCLSNALLAYASYVENFCWPRSLEFLYPLLPQGPWHGIAAAAVFAAVTVACVWQSGSRPYLAVGWCWFLVSLLPSMGLIPGDLPGIADRFTYLAGIGLGIMFSWGGAELLQRLRFCVPEQQP